VVSKRSSEGELRGEQVWETQPRMVQRSFEHAIQDALEARGWLWGGVDVRREAQRGRLCSSGAVSGVLLAVIQDESNWIHLTE